MNSDLLAAEAGHRALQATKIIYLTPAPGSVIDGGDSPRDFTEALRKILAEQPDRIGEAGLSKAAHAIKAIETGTPRVHIPTAASSTACSTRSFSNEGVGSLVYGNDYAQIRKQRRATCA